MLPYRVHIFIPREYSTSSSVYKAAEKVPLFELPPLAPPYTGGETDAGMRSSVSMQRILPLCKGELEGVVEKLK